MSSDILCCAALGKDNPIVDRIHPLFAERDERRYICENTILTTCAANADIDTEWQRKKKKEKHRAEVGRQVGTTWMRKLTVMM